MTQGLEPVGLGPGEVGGGGGSGRSEPNRLDQPLGFRESRGFNPKSGNNPLTAAEPAENVALAAAADGFGHCWRRRRSEA